MPPTRFLIRLDRRALVFLRLFGVRGPDTAWVELDETTLRARFGIGHVETPIDNVVRWRIEGPWRRLTALGIRRSIRHADITFGGNADSGVRLDFREPVAIRPLHAPALYVTVEDPVALGMALTELGIEGEDARRRHH